MISLPLSNLSFVQQIHLTTSRETNAPDLLSLSSKFPPKMQAIAKHLNTSIGKLFD